MLQYFLPFHLLFCESLLFHLFNSFFHFSYGSWLFFENSLFPFFIHFSVLLIHSHHYTHSIQERIQAKSQFSKYIPLFYQISLDFSKTKQKSTLPFLFPVNYDSLSSIISIADTLDLYSLYFILIPFHSHFHFFP